MARIGLKKTVINVRIGRLTLREIYINTFYCVKYVNVRTCLFGYYKLDAERLTNPRWLDHKNTCCLKLQLIMLMPFYEVVFVMDN